MIIYLVVFLNFLCYSFLFLIQAFNVILGFLIIFETFTLQFMLDNSNIQSLCGSVFPIWDFFFVLLIIDYFLFLISVFIVSSWLWDFMSDYSLRLIWLTHSSREELGLVKTNHWLDVIQLYGMCEGQCRYKISGVTLTTSSRVRVKTDKFFGPGFF